VNNVVIDSGSQCCTIRKDRLPDSIISKMKPPNTTARLSDGSKIEFLGRVVNLCVTYLGRTVEMCCKII